MKKQKTKILCVCAKGRNRSRYLAQYLRGKGYSTRYGGVEPSIHEGTDFTNYLEQKDIDWADFIVIVRKRLVFILKKKFKIKNKKVIVLDVTDSKRLIPARVSHLKELDFAEFQKKWTRPQLREAIKPYLPLG